MALFIGMDSTALAEPFNNNVKDCLENPEKCKQNDEKTESGSKNSEPNKEQAVGVSAWDFIKMIGALAFVLALIYFLLRFVNQKSRSYQQTKLIQHLGGSPLGGNRSIQMIKVGERILILGVGEDIKLLKEIEDKEEYDQFIHYYDEQLEQMIQPKDLITRLMHKWNNQKAESTNDQNHTRFKQLLESRLEDMKKTRKEKMKEWKDKENQRDE
jgi:flagellar protein FliO/FliZ